MIQCLLLFQLGMAAEKTQEKVGAAAKSVESLGSSAQTQTTKVNLILCEREFALSQRDVVLRIAILLSFFKTI